MKPLKLRPSFVDRWQQLQGHKLQVCNPATVLDYPERLGYRLSGHLYPLRAINSAAYMAQGNTVPHDGFSPGRCVKDVVRLNVFDKKLWLLALSALKRIGIRSRWIDMAHLLGQHDPRAHGRPIAGCSRARGAAALGEVQRENPC